MQIGVGVFDGRLEANRLVVRGTSPDRDGVGRAVHVEDAEAALTASILENNAAVSLSGLAATMTANQLAVRGTTEVGGVADGILLFDGSTLTGSAIVSEGNARIGLVALGSGSRAEIDHGLFRNNERIGAQPGELGTLALRRTLLEGNGESGLLMQSTLPSAPVELVDSVSQRNGDRGVSVQVGSAVTLTRFVGRENGGAGINIGSISSTESKVVATDARFSLNGGPGLMVQDGGDAELLRVEADRNVRVDVVLRGEGTVVTGSDVFAHHGRVDESKPPIEQTAHGIEITDGADVTLTRVQVEKRPRPRHLCGRLNRNPKRRYRASNHRAR